MHHHDLKLDIIDISDSTSHDAEYYNSLGRRLRDKSDSKKNMYLLNKKSFLGIEKINLLSPKVIYGRGKNKNIINLLHKRLGIYETSHSNMYGTELKKTEKEKNLHLKPKNKREQRLSLYFNKKGSVFENKPNSSIQETPSIKF